MHWRCDAILADHVIELGPATTQAILHLYASIGSHRVLIDTCVLVGDQVLPPHVLRSDVNMT